MCRNPFLIRSIVQSYDAYPNEPLCKLSRNPFLIRSMFPTEYDVKLLLEIQESQSLLNQVNVSNLSNQDFHSGATFKSQSLLNQVSVSNRTSSKCFKSLQNC